MTEKQLVLRCRARDTRAQRELYDQRYHHMYNLAMRYLSNHHDVEDVLTNSFIRVMNKIDQFVYKGNGSLEKWIRTIVINESIRHLNRRQPVDYQDDMTVVSKVTFNQGEIESIDTEEIYHIIENMPPGYRLVFNLFAIEGYSHPEIADSLNISISTSKTQLKKARNYIITRIQK